MCVRERGRKGERERGERERERDEMRIWICFRTALPVTDIHIQHISCIRTHNTDKSKYVDIHMQMQLYTLVVPHSVHTLTNGFPSGPILPTLSNPGLVLLNRLHVCRIQCSIRKRYLSAYTY